MKKGAVPVFEKNWWVKNRARAVKGSGVDKALEHWEKNCKIPRQLKSRQEFEKAWDTTKEVNKALTVAKKKCGARQKETSECISRYFKEVKSYGEQLHREEELRAEQFENSRQETLALAESTLKKENAHLKDVRKLHKAVEKLADEVDKSVRTGNDIDKAVKHMDSMLKLHKGAEKILATAKEDAKKLGVRVGEARKAGRDAKSFGVTELDAKRLEPIFKRTTTTGQQVAGVIQSINIEVENLKTVLATSADRLRGGEATQKSVGKQVEELARFADKAGDLLASRLTDIEKKAKQVGERSKKDDAKLFLGELDGLFTKLVQQHESIEKSVATQLKRVPRALRTDPVVKPQLDKVAKRVSGMRITRVKAEKASETARTAYETMA